MFTFLLLYFNIFLHLYTDASDNQLRAVIMQDKMPVAIYSQKLNTAQERYETIKCNREMLSTIETCKEYKNILLGYHQPKEHKKNTFNGLKENTSDHVLRCILLLEEYGVTFE
jgi:hypothetical protein